VIVPAFVVEQISAAAVGGHHDIQRAVVINIAISSAAADSWRSEGSAETLRHFDELAAANITKHMRRLGVAHALLYLFDLVFDVAVRYQNVGPAVVVVIEEETAEAESDQSRAAHFGAGGFINKKAVAFVVIEGKLVMIRLARPERS